MKSVHGGARSAWLGCLFVVCLSLLLQPARAQSGPSPVDALIQGEAPALQDGGSAMHAAFAEENGPVPLYRELHQAWSVLGQRLATAVAGRDETFMQAPGVREEYASLLARDQLYRHRLNRWAESDQRSESVRAAAAAELQAYNEKVGPWLELIETWLGRADEAAEGSVSGFWYWLTDFWSRWQLEDLQAAIQAAERAAARRPILGNELLPHSRTRPAPVLSLPADPLTPVYARDHDLAPANDDLAAGPLSPLSEAILAKAEQLDYDPVRIFNHVQSEIRTEWYVGAMKGAERTLALGAGNDADKAALLVALLRASSVPARYETGTVRVSRDYLKKALGIQDAAAQRRFLQRNGRAVEPVIENGRINAFDMEYTWVAARVPYANYRGAQVDKSGKLWVPLMPAAAVAERPLAEDFLGNAGVGGDLVADFQAGDGSTSPLAWLRERTANGLSTEGAASLEDRLAVDPEAPATLDLLPASTPFAVRAVAEESAVLPERLRHKVSVLVADPATGKALLDKTLLLADVEGQRLTLSYMPATREIQNTVNSFGGIYTTPSWMVDLRPQLRLNGKRIAVGNAALDMGGLHDTRITLSSPLGARQVERTWMAGGYYALSLVAQQLGENPDYSARHVADTEFSGARLLSQLAARYNRQWLNDERSLATLAGHRVARPWPVLAIAANAYSREFVLDRLQALQWEGVNLDAALHISEPVIAVADPAVSAQEWSRFSALHGSWWESEIYERMFNVAAISADRGLRLASEQGVSVRTLHSGDDLSPLALPIHVTEDIRRWLARGFQVRTPVSEFSFRDWRGAAWWVEDQATGSTGYFISGGLAGGSSADSSWPYDVHQAAMSNIYNDPQLDEDVAVGAIRKLGGSELTVGEPGENGEPVKVMVVDKLGRPMMGKTVNFTVLIGDIQLKETSAVTNEFGVAEVEYAFGTRTDSGNSGWVYLEQEDQYPSQVGVSLVDAWVTDLQRGVVHATEPFKLILGPGPASLQNSSLEVPEYTRSGRFSGNFRLTARDAYGNLVSNALLGVSYDYDATPPTPEEPFEFVPGGVSPVETECRPADVSCAQSSAEVGSDYSGVAIIQYVAGIGEAEATLSVTLDGEDWRSLTHQTYYFKLLKQNPPLDIVSTVNYTPEGEVNTAVGVNKPMAEKKKVWLKWPQSDYEMDRNGEIRLKQGIKSLVPAKPGDDLEFSADHVSIEYEYIGDGLYELSITGGSAPAVQEISMNGTVIIEAEAWWDAEQGEFVNASADYNVSGLTVPGKVWVVKPVVHGVNSGHPEAPERLILGGSYPKAILATTAAVQSSIQPEGYPSTINQIKLMEGTGKQVEAFYFPKGKQGYLQNGISVNADELHNLKYQVDFGIESEPKSVGFYQPIFSYPRDGKRFSGAIQLDVHSDWSCSRGGKIGFNLIHPAYITATVGSAKVLDEVLLDKGYHTLDYASSPGVRDYTITATSALDEHVETRSGKLFISAKYQKLPIGHTLVEGVNLFNGSLSLNRTDFSIGGRGPGIEFNRFYSVTSAGEPSPFGRGWGHSYNGSIQALGCGAYQVNGGLGGGGRFYRRNDGFEPAKGYHGTLRENQEDNSFDFFAKDGTRYHYRKHRFDGSSRWSLEYIEDTNGNRVALVYDEAADRPKLLSVTDDAGRSLMFKYKKDVENLVDFDMPLVERIEGPEGYQVDYSYDSHGRLKKAVVVNGDNPREESYSYPVPKEEYQSVYDFLERDNLKTVTGPLGYTTTYTYKRLPFSTVVSTVPNFAVDKIEKETAQNDVVLMDFTYSDRTAVGDRLTTDINNFRGHSAGYSMDRSGRLLEQTLPPVSYQWYDDDILLKQKTEPYENGLRVTVYEYDEYGNIASEKLNDHPARRKTWYTPSEFSGNGIKNRVKTSEDRNGEVTAYFYDSQGNLEEIEYPDGSSEHFTYLRNGDRHTHRDGNGNTTTYRYDSYGYVKSETTTECCYKGYKWNALGHKDSFTDGRDNTTDYETDKLGRVTRVDYPEAVFEIFSHDAAGNVTSHRNRKGDTITRDYDEAGRMISETWPVDGTRTRTYDPHGNLVQEKDFRGVYTHHEYNERDHRTRTWTEGQTLAGTQLRETLYKVDEQGNVTEEDRGLGRVTTWEYNDLNLPEVITDARGVKAYRYYDHEGNLTSRINRRGFETTFTYDAMNRRVLQQEPLERTLEWAYDGNGNVRLEIDANGNATEREWTQHGELKWMKVLDDEGNLVTEEERFYDDAGNLKRVVDSRGHERVHHYDDFNRVVRKERPAPLGVIRYTEHDGAGNVLTEEWPNGNVITRRWDHRNRLLSESDLIGPRKARTYDGNGNLLTETDARGTTIMRQYNDFNEVEREELPQHNEGELIVTHEYDALGNERFRRVNDTLSRHDELAWETRYDLLDRPTHEIDPLGQEAITEYDAEGNPERLINKRGHATRQHFDALNRLERVEEPLGRTREKAYDPHSNLVREVDGQGIATEYRYDGLHRRVETRRDGLVIDRRRFDGEGNLQWEEDALGYRTAYEYYDADLVQQETGEEAAVTRYTYTPSGELKTRTDPENHTTTREYDARNRKTAETNAEGERTEFDYDGNGNLTARYTPRYTAGELGGSQHWQYHYTLDGQLESATDPAGNTTRYRYNGRGQRLSVTDAAQKTTRWRYDALGRPERKSYPDGAFHSYLAYDANGNLQAEADPDGRRTEYDHDALDRETERRHYHADGTLHTKAVRDYDLNNNLIGVTETRQGQSWATRFTYDPFDRRTHKEDRFGQTLTWGYDKNGNRTSLSSSAGHAVSYRYDRRNRLASVITGEGATDYDYYRNGLLKRIDYASGATAAYNYDAADRIQSITNRHNGADVSVYAYDYDANGNRTGQTEQNGFGEEVTTYTHDAADRLKEVTYPDKTEVYTFDEAWNRVTETITEAGTVVSDKALSYNDRQQLTDIQDSAEPANNVTYTYDGAGNQIQKTKAGVTTSFVYDARNNLREVTTGGSTVGQFLYDYQGLRTEKQGERGTERYSHDDQAVLFQTDESGAVQARYQYGPNRLLSLKQPDLPTEFYLFDALRSPVTLVRKDGSITARYAYDAWGEKRHESGDSFNRFGFTGHEHDEETGLIYAKARYYDPEVARFLSEDPFAGEPDMPPSLHKYLYAYQNPTVYVDPDGRRACGPKEFAADCDEGTGALAERRENRDEVADADNQAPPTREERNQRCLESDDCSLYELDEQDGKKAEEALRHRRETQVAEAESKPETAEGSLSRSPGQEHLRRVQTKFRETGEFIGDGACDLNPVCSAFVLAEGRLPASQRELETWERAVYAVPGGFAASRVIKGAPKSKGSLSAESANAPHIAKGNRPPYAKGSRAREIVLQNARVFVRVHGEGNQARSWMMRPKDIEGLSAEQIQRRFALPEKPSYVSDVYVPAGTRVRVGTVAEQPGWGQGGGTQYELQQRLPENAFRNKRPLND